MESPLHTGVLVVLVGNLYSNWVTFTIGSNGVDGEVGDGNDVDSQVLGTSSFLRPTRLQRELKVRRRLRHPDPLE